MQYPDYFFGFSIKSTPIPPKTQETMKPTINMAGIMNVQPDSITCMP